MPRYLFQGSYSREGAQDEATDAFEYPEGLRDSVALLAGP
jgi:hypothetical protein